MGLRTLLQSECTAAGKKGKEKAYPCVSHAFWLVTTKTHFSENFLILNLLGKLVFKLDHVITFEDTDRFGLLKIIDYLHYKFFKMTVL
jgi:hypothetical protein